MDKPKIVIVCFCEGCDPDEVDWAPSADGKLLTRVEWLGTDPKTKQPIMTMEMQAGMTPNAIEYPGLNWSANACWCPGCKVCFHIGQRHPNEPAPPEEEKPKIELVN